jgi:hypothetical protein
MFLKGFNDAEDKGARGKAEASFCGLGATGNATLRIPWSILEIVFVPERGTWESRIAGIDHGVVLVGHGLSKIRRHYYNNSTVLCCTVGMSYYYCGSMRAIIVKSGLAGSLVKAPPSPSPAPGSHRSLQGVEHSRAQPAKTPTSRDTLRTVDSVTVPQVARTTVLYLLFLSQLSQTFYT